MKRLILIMCTFIFLSVLFQSNVKSVYAQTDINSFYTFEGDGTMEKPFLINNIIDLHGLQTNVLLGEAYEGKYFNLINDIYFDDEYDWEAIGDENNYFGGHFNGRNHTIYGLSNSNKTGDLKGLFGYCVGATIVNLSLVDGEIIGENNVGGIAGILINGYVKNCYTNQIIVGSDNIGGIVGSLYNSEIKESINYSDITGYKGVGGIAGKIADGTNIENCENYGSVIGENSCGQICGIAEKSSVYFGCIIDSLYQNDENLDIIFDMPNNAIGFSNDSVEMNEFEYSDESTNIKSYYVGYCYNW